MLEGYYYNPVTGTRYLFEITEYGSGDYGGTRINLNDTTNVSVWSIVDTTVYINGEATYTYDGTILYTNIVEGLVIENDIITGSVKRTTTFPNQETIEWEYVFYANGSVEHRQGYVLTDYNETYTIEGNIVKFGGNRTSWTHWYLYNEQLYEDILLPL